MTDRKGTSGPRPSPAQARELAYLFAGHARLVYTMAPAGRPDPFIPPTIAALLRAGWISPMGDAEDVGNGYRGCLHGVNVEGIKALTRFFATLKDPANALPK